MNLIISSPVLLRVANLLARDVARHFQVPKDLSKCNTEYGAKLMIFLND